MTAGWILAALSSASALALIFSYPRRPWGALAAAAAWNAEAWRVGLPRGTGQGRPRVRAQG